MPDPCAAHGLQEAREGRRVNIGIVMLTPLPPVRPKPFPPPSCLPPRMAMRVEVSRMELGESQLPCRVLPAALQCYAALPAGAQGTGLRLFTVKQGRRVTIDRRS